jgi:pimeloyl-ACP methyl ester carboxylesterase
MRAALEAAGYATLNLDYASRSKSLGLLADDIHCPITSFAGKIDGSLHFAAHSMGGLLTRAYLARYRPERLGRVVMLGTPNGGSEIADALRSLSAYRRYFGPAGQQLTTIRDPATSALLPAVDYPVGIIAGNRSIYPISRLFLPRPNDGRVSVENTKLDGMADHVVISTAHPWLMRNRQAIELTLVFLRRGRFEVE